MKCRMLSPTLHNIVWFGKTGEDLDYVWYQLDSSPGEPGTVPKPDMYTVTGTIFANLIGCTFADLGTFAELDTESVTYFYLTINGTTYTCYFDYGSEINGHILNPSNNVVGIFTLTNLAAPNTSPTSYSEDTDAVVDSLMQRLSVLKGELWYQINFGLPLTEKVRGTTLFDMVIMDIITSHPGVASLTSFSSNIKNHTYTFTGQIQSVFGDDLTISNSYRI